MNNLLWVYKQTLIYEKSADHGMRHVRWSGLDLNNSVFWGCVGWFGKRPNILDSDLELPPDALQNQQNPWLFDVAFIISQEIV